MLAASTEPRFLLAVAMLLGASLLDIQTRRVANLYWIPFLCFAVILDSVDLWTTGDLVGPAMALGLCGLFYLFWRFRLFGGADAKGLMVLALLLPPTTGGSPVPTVLGSLGLASALAGLGVPLAMLAWNLAHGRFVLPAMLLGAPMDLERARRAHVWPMQEPAPTGGLRWRYLRHVGSDVEARLDALQAAGVARPWVTPKVPFMLPLMLGVAAWPSVAALLEWPRP
ncbi:MAG TPA: prepilin peptidase [Candidatus Thermoplasmatota archaeon]|nr:prepilin peptidase [Candidatus Thermoplasmatota archaeon]